MITPCKGVAARNTGKGRKKLVGARLEATWGQVRASDADITSTKSLNLITKANRNLTFKSPISEIALVGEFYPLTLWAGENDKPLVFAPYVAAGVGRFTFNPQTLYLGQWVDLKNLHTEGQGFEEYKNVKPYSTTQFNIPLGIGVQYEASPTVHLRLEFLHRLLFTDYLDDASSRGYVDPAVFKKYLSPLAATYATSLYNPSKNGKLPARRGNPDNKDAYMTLSVKLRRTSRNGCIFLLACPFFCCFCFTFYLEDHLEKNNIYRLAIPVSKWTRGEGIKGANKARLETYTLSILLKFPLQQRFTRNMSTLRFLGTNRM